MICPKCSITNAEGVKFCKGCGSLIQEPARKNLCPNGHPLDPAWGNVCPYCNPGASADSGKSVKREPTIREDNPPKPPDFQARRKTKTETDDSQKRKKTVIASVSGEEQKLPPGSKNRLVGFLITFSMDPSGQFFEIREGRHIIGKGNDADISIPGDNMMSSRHAVLLYRRGKFLFHDELSTNGSFINGEEAVGDVELNNYDMLKTGNTDFRFIMVNPVNEESL